MSEYTIGDITGLMPENSMFKQGDVWLLDLGDMVGHEQGGERPVLIVSSTSWNAKSKTPMVCPCTTSKNKGKNPFCVEIDTGDGKRSFVNASHIYTLSVERFADARNICTIPFGKKMKVAKIMRRLLYVD